MENGPTVMVMVETHLSKEDKIEEIEGYRMIRREREEEEGGGILIMVRDNMKPLLVEREDEKESEMVWVKIKNARIVYNIGVIYMPQENNKTKGQLQKIYAKIEEEVTRTKQAGEKILIIGDFNCKVGKEIEGNHDRVSKGGKMLNKMITKQGMSIVNSMNICNGLWTRVENNKKSILDYVMTFKEDGRYIKSMKIDESRLDGVYSVKQRKNPKVVLSDHNRIDLRLNILEAAIEENKEQISRIMTKEGYRKFETLCNRNKISKQIKEGSINSQYTRWSKQVKGLKEKCEKRVKQKNKDVSTKHNRTMRKIEKAVKKEIKKGTYNKEESKIATTRLRMIRSHIEDENSKINKDRIDRTIEEIKEQGGVTGETFWKFKKKFQKREEEPVSMVYGKRGERIEEENGIKERYREYYTELLKPKEPKCESEIEREKRVNQSTRMIVAAGLQMKQKEITIEDLEVAKKQLKKKKAKDRDGWNNELIIEGGKEMDASIVNILNQIQQEKSIVKEWTEMTIKSVKKKGSSSKLDNRRGLFLTNIIGKVYERIIKNRNTGIKISNHQCGGVKGRSVVDHLIMLMSIIERNKYFGKESYVVFADAVKCFDKLWLEDGIRELIEAGMRVEDAAMIYKMNEKADIVVQCPAGKTDAINAENTVRQGTVFGPILCAVSTDKINTIGERIKSSIGPNLEVGALVFMDDIASIGDKTKAEETIRSMRRLETQKKFTFSQEKSAYLIANGTSQSEKLETRIEMGILRQVKEYKYLGTIVNDDMDMKGELKKMKGKIMHKVQTVRNIASERNIGSLAVSSRLQMVESVIIPSILVNVEAWLTISPTELKELEKAQATVLKKIFEMPISTPYLGMLMEAGVLPVRARITYKRLMLYHGVMCGDKERLLRQLFVEQKLENRKGTWVVETMRIGKECNIDVERGEEMSRKVWKKMIKEKIREVEEKRIKDEAKDMTKLRFIKDDKFERKKYLENTTPEEAKIMMKVRLNMLGTKENYRSNDSDSKCEWCWEDDTTEHLFKCKRTRRVREVYDISEDNIYNTKEDKAIKNTVSYIKAINQMRLSEL